MSITFSIVVSTPAAAKSTSINARQLGAFRIFAREHGGLHDLDGDDYLPETFEARVCPWSMASICALFDHDLGVILIVEEAQFRGLNIRFWRDATNGTIMMGVATSLDGSGTLDLANANAFAVLDALGIDPDNCGRIAIDDLSDRLNDTDIRTRFLRDDIACYAPQLAKLVNHSSEDEEVQMVWG